MALVTSEPRKATVRATSAELALRELGREQFERLVGPLGKNMDELRRRFHVAAYSFGQRDYAKVQAKEDTTCRAPKTPRWNHGSCATINQSPRFSAALPWVLGRGRCGFAHLCDDSAHLCDDSAHLCDDSACLCDGSALLRPKLFRHYDRDNSGFLEELEFRAVRRRRRRRRRRRNLAGGRAGGDEGQS